MTVQPPQWDEARLSTDLGRAIEMFRETRMKEPRASIMGAVALAAGERFDDAAEAVVRKGLAAESWDHILGAGRRAWGAD